MRVGSYDYYILHIITFNSQSSTLSTRIFSYLPTSSFACENLSCLYSSAASPLNPSIRTFTLQSYDIPTTHLYVPVCNVRHGDIFSIFFSSQGSSGCSTISLTSRDVCQISFQVRSGYINSVSLKCDARESKSNVARVFCMSFDSCGSKRDRKSVV